MTPNVFVLPPLPDRRPRPRPLPRPRPGRRPGRLLSSPLVPADSVSVEWSPERGAYVTACARCTETALPITLDKAERWADAHVCDPEMVALLDQIIGGRAA